MGIPRTPAPPGARLHRLLRAALPPGSVSVGLEVTAVDRAAPDRVRVRTRAAPFSASPASPAVEAGAHAATGLDADLVVAADGVNSRTRATLFPDHPGPAHSGSTVLRAVTEEALDLAIDFEITWGHGAEFGHTTFVDGRAEWHAVLDSPAGVRHADPLDEVRRRFADWHQPVARLLDATRPEAVLHHDIHELAVPLPSFVSGRVALLGDTRPTR